MSEIKEERFLSQIRRDKFKRKDIAITYSFCLDNPNLNWERINKAIVDRWSLSGLKYIKKEAFELYDKYNKPKSHKISQIKDGGGPQK